ncbi:MAG TPA: cytochrome c, partial [Xanthomonadales bacterium]|nr:cytochrome c [Xanthomonadales bacterium]
MLALVLLCAGPARAQEPAPDPSAQAQTLVHLLDYVAVDYPEFVRDGEVLDAAEYAEQAEFAAEVARRLPALESGEAPGPLEQDAQRLVDAIAARAAGSAVSAQAIALRDAVVATFGVAARPRGIPDLAAAAPVYAEQCAMCHGIDGHGDGPAGAMLEPAPSDFHDDARMQQRSVFGLYNTITLGVGGTGMAAYRQLDDDTRWALAFHVATLRHDDALRAAGAQALEDAPAPPVRDLGALVATDAKTLAARGVAEAPAVMAYLLAKPR